MFLSEFFFKVKFNSLCKFNKIPHRTPAMESLIRIRTCYGCFSGVFSKLSEQMLTHSSPI